MHVMTGSKSFGYSIRKFWLLMRVFIALRVAFNQGFLIFYDNFFTSSKFLGSGTKWDTSELDSHKLVSCCKISDKIVLNTLFKYFPILCVAFNAPFHSYCLCLMRSRILQRASLLIKVGWV